MRHKLKTDKVLQNLIDGALVGTEIKVLLEEFCKNTVDVGIPLMRVQLAISTLHPLVESVDFVWWRDSDLEYHIRTYTSEPRDKWLSSPFFWMLEKPVVELRQDLSEGALVEQDFPIFADFRKYGATDYFASLIPFGIFESAAAGRDGAMISWLSDSKDGFCPSHIEWLRRAHSYLGLIAKLSNRESTAQNVATAYLGENAGQRVLKGQIRLGDVEQIPAIVWFSDLRSSTTLAEEMSAEQYLGVLNSYFECTAGAILNHGGEVLSFIGDGVFAVFPITNDRTSAVSAQLAIDACVEARLQLANLNKLRLNNGEGKLEFGLGLHVGNVMFGNIGVSERLEFTVIGTVANEVSRLEGLTKTVGVPVLVSSTFADLLNLQWKNLGIFEASGVEGGLHVFEPPVNVLSPSLVA